MVPIIQTVTLLIVIKPTLACSHSTARPHQYTTTQKKGGKWEQIRITYDECAFLRPNINLFSFSPFLMI